MFFYPCTVKILSLKFFIVFALQFYMYAAWHGWVIPMFLFLALLRLSLNYLIARSVHPTSFESANQPITRPIPLDSI